MALTAIPAVVSGYLGIVAYWPKINIEALEPLDKSDALSAPFEISNTGFFALKNLTFEWKPRHVENSKRNSSVSGYGTFTTYQRIKILRPEDRGPVMSSLAEMFGPADKADLIVAVRYEPRWLPFKLTREFRFITKTTKDGEIRWYRRPME